jgi:hypothetical protein
MSPLSAPLDRVQQPSSYHRQPVAFSLADAVKAGEEWGANCGPGALAAITGKTLDDVRPHLLRFDEKRYTNPAMMRGALRSLGVRHEWRVRDRAYLMPLYGLARVQWDGPWTQPGVPAKAAYRHTHWVAARMTPDGDQVFDINCICVGGWVSFNEWQRQVVPWLLKQCEPKATGDWWLTHLVEVESAKALQNDPVEPTKEYP